jgi:hypothetical protein
MQEIYKYEIPAPSIKANNVAQVMLPAQATILHFGTQVVPGPSCTRLADEVLYVWAMVDPESQPTPWHIMVVPTGGKVPDPDQWSWVATIQFTSHQLVFHLFQSLRLAESNFPLAFMPRRSYL